MAETIQPGECIEKIMNAFAQIGHELTNKQAEQFFQYYEMLVETNKVMNLTAITEFDEVLQKHFVDSVLKSEIFIKEDTKTLIDVGTGAGFPGVPLKIMYPELKVTLLDSLNKRLNFLNQVIEQLGLENITTVHFRAEDGARKAELREQFDCVVSRAVANMSTLCEYCLPYVKVGGCFVAYKSGNAEEEIDKAKKAVHLLGGVKENAIYFDLPDSDIGRSLVIVKKKSLHQKNILEKRDCQVRNHCSRENCKLKIQKKCSTGDNVPRGTFFYGILKKEVLYCRKDAKNVTVHRTPIRKNARSV